MILDRFNSKQKKTQYERYFHKMDGQKAIIEPENLTFYSPDY